MRYMILRKDVSKKIISLTAAVCACVFSLGLQTRGAFRASAKIGQTPVFALDRSEVCLTVEANGKFFEYSYPEIDVENGKPYLKKIDEVVEDIYYSSLVPPVDAAFVCHPEQDEPFVFVAEKVGLGVDKRALLKGIEKTLERGGGKFCVTEYVEVKPRVTREELKSTMRKRGEFSTRYSSSAASRKKNISLACRQLNLTEIANGEEFSFNAAVGERTEERGYSTAKVIENGKFVEGVGGGVCQVSSTVYNCALLSGLTVTERHRHSLAVSYVEPSFDAMVSYSYADLRFYNDTGKSVFIVADADGERVRVRFYGLPNPYRYKRISVVNELIEPLPEEIIRTDELLAGETKRMVFAKKGMKSAGVIEKYLGEKMLERKLLVTDEYSPLRGITLEGSRQPDENGR